jgi:acyl dehydratase
MRLAGGLPSATLSGLSALIAEITGTPPRAAPWLAPALLLAAPEVAPRLALPRAGGGEALVHEYQGADWQAPLPPDVPLTAAAARKQTPGGAEYRFDLGPEGAAPAVSLTTALRVLAETDIAAAPPVPFRTAALRTAAISSPMRVTQAQADRYLALSGDDNPIHRDPAAAGRLGRAAPLVPGLLLLALVQPAAEAAFAAPLSTLKARFMGPLEMDESLRLALLPRGAGRARALLLAGEDRALAAVDLAFAA